MTVKARNADVSLTEEYDKRLLPKLPLGGKYIRVCNLSFDTLVQLVSFLQWVETKQNKIKR